MWESIVSWFADPPGASSNALGEVALRTVAIYLAGLTLIRLGNARLLARYGPFDIIIAYILGSLLSRGINGEASMASSLMATAVLILLHSMLAAATFYSETLGTLFKGRPRPLVEDGQVQHDELRRARISLHDLREVLHLNAHLDDPAQVKRAYLERNGDLGIIPQPRQAQVVEIDVRDGVQTVRIELV